MLQTCAVLAPTYMANYYVVVISLIVILVLAYYTTKWLSKSRITGSGNNMKVIERLYLASDKQLLIVQVDTSYYLMSQTKQDIKLIEKLIDYVPEPKTDMPKFSDMLDKIRNNKEK